MIKALTPHIKLASPLLLILLLVPAYVNALPRVEAWEPLKPPDVFADGDHIIDTTTGLKWLKPMVTHRLSRSTVESEMVEGGRLEGYRYATFWELDELVAKFSGIRRDGDWNAYNLSVEFTEDQNEPVGPSVDIIRMFRGENMADSLGGFIEPTRIRTMYRSAAVIWFRQYGGNTNPPGWLNFYYWAESLGRGGSPVPYQWGHWLVTEYYVNPPPEIFLPDPQKVEEGQTIHATVGFSDDKAMASIRAVGMPEGASFSDMTGEFVWTPDFFSAGEYQVTFEVNDNDPVDPKQVSAVWHLTIDESSDPITLCQAMSEEIAKASEALGGSMRLSTHSESACNFFSGGKIKPALNQLQQIDKKIAEKLAGWELDPYYADRAVTLTGDLRKLINPNSE